jgi:hypothetical protein
MFCVHAYESNFLCTTVINRDSVNKYINDWNENLMQCNAIKHNPETKIQVTNYKHPQIIEFMIKSIWAELCLIKFI